jgi:hypothetical protein
MSSPQEPVAQLAAPAIATPAGSVLASGKAATKSAKELSRNRPAVERLLQPATFAELRNNSSTYKNNALYEIPEFLEEIVQRKERPVAGLGSPVRGMRALEKAAWATLTRMGVSPA